MGENKSATILIDDGVKEYEFKNKFGDVFARFRFNPADTGIVRRYDAIVEYFEKLEYPSDLSEDEVVEEIKRLEDGIKEQFNVLCGYPVADGLFMTYQPLTCFACGDTFAEIALENICKFVEEELDTRLAKKKAKIKKATAKYHK